MRLFPKAQYKILHHLYKTKGNINFDNMEKELQFPSTQIYGDCITLESMSLIKIKEDQNREIMWKGFDDDHKDLKELPERTIIKVLRDLKGKARIPEINSNCILNPKIIGKTLKILELKKWAKNEKGMMVLNEEYMHTDPAETDDEKLIGLLVKDQRIYDNEIDFIDIDKALSFLKPRNKWFSVKQRKQRYASLTEYGIKLVEDGIQMRDTITDLTPDLLIDNKYKEVDFKSYDVNDISDPIPFGKLHPMTKVINNARRIFIEMGFQEIRYTNIESSFWDFDALFQPQDHPAREMQDTFYLKKPNICALPEDNIVQSVKEVHETGSNTGSKGWRYKWDIDKSRKAILRTHTTAATIRALHEDPNPPRKVFLVGKVFRRETIDYKHLPFFHQVDGIIIDEEANLQNLLGTLDIFYRKMGFSKFYFRPAFFPYTEPSVEVFVYNNKKNDWMEMGGAGIFREEVTRPLGCNVPVLAWGLGLERIAMFQYDIDFMKDLYISDLEWLKEVKVCP